MIDGQACAEDAGQSLGERRNSYASMVPNLDAFEVDFSILTNRNKMYLMQEKDSWKNFAG